MQFTAIGQNKHSVSGKVLDQQNLPVMGATVQILNTNQLTVVNSDGNFHFNNLSAGKFTLKISAVGYAITNTLVTVPSTGIFEIQLTSNNFRLDEVTVSAQKREENIQDLPFSISAFSTAQVQAYGMTNVRDLKTIVPNLNAANPGDGRNVVSVRGITTTSYDPAVATYIDGVNQFGLDTYISQLLDIERIEVLRGPQGTLYGRNAMGGVINVITKQPTNQTRCFAKLDMGNYGNQRYTLGIRTPLIKDKLYFGATGMYDNFKGYYQNVFNNTGFDKQLSLMGNYFLKYLANDELSIVLNVKHNANRNNGTFPLVGSIADAIEKPFEVNQNAIGQMSDNLFNASLGFNYSGRKFTLSSQTAYQYNYRYYKSPVDGDFSPLDGFSILNNYGRDWNKVQVLTQEFKLTSPASVDTKLRWTTGIYGFYQYNPVKQGTHGGSDAEAMGSEMANFTSINTNTGESMGLALYGQVTYALTTQLDATFGMRYDYEHKKLKGFAEFFMDGDVPVVFLDNQLNSESYHSLSPKLNLAYKLSEMNRLYLSYSRGFRAGGINQTTDQDIRFVNYNPEYSNTFEAGTKNTFLNNRLRFNLAGFYNRLTDAQVPTLLLPQAITITQNAGKLSSKGIEAELSASPLKGLEFEGGMGYTDAKYTDLKLADNGQVLTLDGNKQIFSPKTTAAIAMQYTYEIGGVQKLKLIIRGEWQRSGEQYFDLKNLNKQEAYDLLNARIGLSGKSFDLFLWGKNLDNQTYIDYAYDFGAAHLGNPRTYGLSLGLHF
jgi:iron complex outermembrane receptor protein